MPSLASTPWTWSVQLVRSCTSLPRYLVISRSSRIPAGATPRLRQPAHPQQAGQVAGVELVVLDPAVPEGLHPERMGQVHLGAGRRQRVRRPVPAVAGLQHHLRVQARPPDLGRQPRRAAGDPRGAQLLAILGHPDQHRPAPVQVHAHDLRAVVRFRQGPPIVVDDVDTPSMNAWDSYGEREGPAPSWHQES
jgi:hypothetical protein